MAKIFGKRLIYAQMCRKLLKYVGNELDMWETAYVCIK